ncbi:MAG: class IV adenylate cyclase [Chloroflexi bacterium HGW-Chloroflexi-3]|nr:MAG: class IV adenylate cyclase [Chloroflexi bacterium HGW-Chloroflexi-3]
MKKNNDVEIEVKFYVLSLKEIEQKILKLGGTLLQERCFESNLRFDTADGHLRNQRHVLRLRKDKENILTFKGAAEAGKPVSIRQEIEVLVDDFDTARTLLEGLGFEVVMAYEKYRTTYSLLDTLVVLDELPYGNFIEIEGPNGTSIQKVARNLNLNWKARVMTSYTYLYEALRKERPELQGKYLTFEELKGMRFMPDELGVSPADLP